ncbi:MAG: tetratricopeptide repeat protein [Pseudonocardiales bacterium]|nr:tetratricopeptide repeat protein [Pseudonocardiales bacterium]
MADPGELSAPMMATGAGLRATSSPALRPPAFQGWAARRWLIVLSAAAAWHPGAAAALFALLRRRPALVAHATAPIIQLVTDRAPDDIAAAVDSALPRYRAELLWPAAALARRVYDTLPATAGGAQRAHRLDNLGLRLSALGRWEDAVLATTEAVGVYRRLSATNRTAFEPDLARSLNNLSVMLSDGGRHCDALAASTQAVDIRRRLATVNRTAFEPGLAMALNNLSVVLSNLSRRAEALSASTQAVEIYRRLAATDPAAFEPGLARALTNLGADLSDLGRLPDALIVTTQAVDIRRQLAAANPSAFEPDLARGLWVFARVRAAGQVELPQALTAARESVALFEGMVQQCPRVFTGDLRGARATLSDVLDRLGRGQGVSS